MHIDDLVLVGVAQSLKSLSKDQDDVLKLLKAKIGLNAEVLRQDKERSIAFVLADGRELPVAQALTEFQKLGGVEQVTLGALEEPKSELPEEMRAAFANTSRTVLSFRCQGKKRNFLVRVQRSRSTTLTFRNMVELVQAQPIRDQIWSTLANQLNSKLEMQGSPRVYAKDLPQYFKDPLRESDLGYEKPEYLQEIQLECKLAHQPLVIPEHLKETLEHVEPAPSPAPEVSDDPRADARARFYDEPYWAMKTNPVRWEVYGLCEIENARVSGESVKLGDAVQNFEKILERTKKFAEKIDSSFTEAFRYAQFLLTASSLSEAGPEKDFVAKVQAELKAKQFSEIALAICNQTIWIVPFLTSMGLSSEAVRALAAYDTIRDIFGGMGSWNDQGYDDATDQAEYSACSSSLYESLMSLFMASLNR
ncbi:MAG: hypothetical protein ACJ763_18480 [Bdellovibrionia bacterium]